MTHINTLYFPISRAGRCDNIRSLRFQTNNVGLVAAGNVHSEHLVAIEQYVLLHTCHKSILNLFYF